MITKIKSGRIIEEDGILDGAFVYIQDGTITAVTEEDLPFDEEYDAQGSYVAPGFIDLHVHGALGHDFSDGTPEGMIEAICYHASHGTTTIFPTTYSTSMEELGHSLQRLRTALSSGKIRSTVAGIHLEGPYFSPKQCGAQNPEFVTAPVKEEYEALLDRYGDLICRWSLAPELEGSEEFMKKLQERGVAISVGHSDAVYEDVQMAMKYGCQLITHFFSCTSTITREKGYRKLGVMESGYLLDELFVEAIADGHHIPKELFRMLVKIKGIDRICLVTDAIKCCGQPEGEAISGGLPIKIVNGVAKLMDESAFAGSVATADQLIRFCVKEVGLELWEAVKMMTKNPAKVMGLKNKGSLKPGYDADLVFFDKEEMRIEHVMTDGRFL